MSGVAVTFTVDGSQVEPGAEQAEQAVRAATERMQGYMESMASRVANDTAAISSHLAGAFVDKVVDRGMDDLVDRMVDVGETGAEVTVGVIGVRAAMSAMAVTVGEAAIAFAPLAAGIAGVAATTYVLYSAADAVTDWAGRVSGATDLVQRFSAEGRAAAESHRLLALELGNTADAFVHMDQVARDFGVNQDVAVGGLRHLAEALDQNNDKTKAARDTLQAYGFALDRLSGRDAPRVLDDLKDRLLGVRDGAQKTADVIAILGNDGVKWLSGLADAAAKPSHAYGEADAILASLNQRIEESNKRIAEHKTWWGGVTERVDAMITRTEEFKAKQEYALSHVTLAYRELTTYGVIFGHDLTNVWGGLTQTAEDYGRLLASKIIPLQGLVKPLEIPAPTVDTRSGSPVQPLPAEKVEDKTVEAAAAALEQLKLQRENWLSWNREREIQFWQDLQAEIFAEWSQSMSRQEIEASDTWRRIEEKKAQLGRSQVQEDARPQGGGREAAAFETWKNQLEQRKAEEGRWFSYSREEEERFWQGKLATVAQGSREYQQIERQLLELRKEGAREGYDILQATLKADQQAHRGDAAYQLEIQRQIERSTAEHFGTLSGQHQRSILETQAAERSHQEQMKQLATMGVDARIQGSRSEFDAIRQRLAFEREMGQISAAEEVQRTAKAEQTRHADEMARMREKRAMIQGDVVARRQADLQIEQLERQHVLRMNQLVQQESLARRNSVREWLQPITAATQGMLQGVLQGTQTVQQLVGNLLTNVAASYAAKSLEMATGWMADRLAEAIFGEAMAEEESAAKGASAIESAIMSKTQALGEISAAAAAGAAWAMASVAAIPFVGWAMAPAVGAEHYAMAMSFAATLAVPSAAGGWKVDRDSLAMVHEDERILPARYSAGLDALVDGAGSGAGGGAANDGSPNISLNFAPVFHGGVNKAEILPILRSQKADLIRILDEGRRNFTRDKR